MSNHTAVNGSYELFNGKTVQRKPSLPSMEDDLLTPPGGPIFQPSGSPKQFEQLRTMNRELRKRNESLEREIQFRNTSDKNFAMDDVLREDTQCDQDKDSKIRLLERSLTISQADCQRLTEMFNQACKEKWQLEEKLKKMVEETATIREQAAQETKAYKDKINHLERTVKSLASQPTSVSNIESLSSNPAYLQELEYLHKMVDTLKATVLEQRTVFLKMGFPSRSLASWQSQLAPPVSSKVQVVKQSSNMMTQSMSNVTSVSSTSAISLNRPIRQAEEGCEKGVGGPLLARSPSVDLSQRKSGYPPQALEPVQANGQDHQRPGQVKVSREGSDNTWTAVSTIMVPPPVHWPQTLVPAQVPRMPQTLGAAGTRGSEAVNELRQRVSDMRLEDSNGVRMNGTGTLGDSNVSDFSAAMFRGLPASDTGGPGESPNQRRFLVPLSDLLGHSSTPHGQDHQIKVTFKGSDSRISPHATGRKISQSEIIGRRSELTDDIILPPKSKTELIAKNPNSVQPQLGGLETRFTHPSPLDQPRMNSPLYPPQAGSAYTAPSELQPSAAPGYTTGRRLQEPGYPGALTNQMQAFSADAPAPYSPHPQAQRLIGGGVLAPPPINQLTTANANPTNNAGGSGDGNRDVQCSEGGLFCPVCNERFSDNDMDEFQTHVYDCFDRDNGPETLQPDMSGNSPPPPPLIMAVNLRTCPMCQQTFEMMSMSQTEFEQHVHRHFGEESFEVLAQ